jgi:hypothetical protein
VVGQALSGREPEVVVNGAEELVENQAGERQGKGVALWKALSL